jgi:hypothetical protein
MPTTQEQNRLSKESGSKPQTDGVNKSGSRTKVQGLFPGSRQDLLRALMMHEVLAQPKCKQSSLRKQS